MAQKPANTTENNTVQFVFGKRNYQILIASIFVVIIGFALMSGETDLYSFRKIVLAPIVVLAGFGLGFYSILRKREVKA